MFKDNSQRLSNYFCLLAFLIAFITTAVLMMGDQYGRVNLFYLVLIFVFVPVVSLAVSLYCILVKSPFNLSYLFLQFPFWPKNWVDVTSSLQQAKLRKPWLFYQSQKLALMLSIGALIAFFGTLLVSDIAFVWRSTLLNAQQVFPLLQFIALPWSYIDTAQPLMEHVVASQDSRLVVASDLSNTGVWWRYVLMAQLIYVLLPRTMLFVIGKMQLSRIRAAIAKDDLNANVDTSMVIKGAEKLESINQRSIDLSQSALLNWAVLPDVLQAQLIQRYGKPKKSYDIGASATTEDIEQALNDPLDKYLLIASWEPPMGELEDFMRESTGTLLVLDWDEAKFQTVSPVHLDEWRRFCFPIEHWQLQQLEVLV